MKTKASWKPKPAFNLRMPEDLWDKLRDEAEGNNRSLNQEINYRLRKSLEGWKR
jgi:hypothetical protein